MFMRYQDIYQIIAEKLNAYYDNRNSFDDMCESFYAQNLPEWRERLKNRNINGRKYDPLTLLCVINGHKSKRRALLLNELCVLLDLDIKCDNQEQFLGVSIVNHSHRTIPGNKALGRYDESVDLCWEILHSASIYVNNPSDTSNREVFIESFDKLNEIVSRSWDKLSHALSYCYPDVFLALSTPNRIALKTADFIDEKIYKKVKEIELYKISGKIT